MIIHSSSDASKETVCLQRWMLFWVVSRFEIIVPLKKFLIRFSTSSSNIRIQAALVICKLFICDFAYMRLKLWHFRGTHPSISNCYWSHYMQVLYMRTNFLGPYVSHITRADCLYILNFNDHLNQNKMRRKKGKVIFKLFSLTLNAHEYKFYPVTTITT